MQTRHGKNGRTLEWSNNIREMVRQRGRYPVRIRLSIAAGHVEWAVYGDQNDANIWRLLPQYTLLWVTWPR